MYVVGTAGHVDHGKSTLVKALTGIDPDRLREEKERGLTIDLGFAWLELPSGREISIVDVPGHERFIKNMLAGAGGVDLALLVVAADEGPMPQTREHLAILDLLDVQAGIVVLTKCDLVDDDYLDLVEAEIDDTVAGSHLAGAPKVRTSATTGAGLDALLATIDAALERTPRKRDLGRPRLPIDRAFTIQGFGVVVTGTLVDGALQVGQEVEIQPGRLRARVRGLQRHKSRVERLEPGTRAAVNLSGIHVEDVRRGMVVATPGAIKPAHAVDVRLRATRILSHSLAHDAGITFLSATSESEGKLRLLDCDDLRPGDECWAQVVLHDPAAVVPGDHCIIRTPNETAGGGVIVAVNPRRHRRNHPPTLDSLSRQLQGAPAGRLVDLLLAGPVPAQDVAARLGIEPADALAAIEETTRDSRVSNAAGLLYATAWLDSALARLEPVLTGFLEANPLRSGVPREHVRSSLKLEPGVFATVVAHGVARGTLAERAAHLAPAGRHVSLSAAQQRATDEFLASLRAGMFSPPTENIPHPDLLAYLVEQRLVEDTGAGVVFDREIFDQMVQRVREHIANHGTISLAEVRDHFGTSRKYAQAFLERLDALRITRRVGDQRVLR